MHSWEGAGDGFSQFEILKLSYFAGARNIRTEFLIIIEIALFHVKNGVYCYKSDHNEIHYPYFEEMGPE